MIECFNERCKKCSSGILYSGGFNAETCEVDAVIVCDLKEDNCPYQEVFWKSEK